MTENFLILSEEEKKKHSYQIIVYLIESWIIYNLCDLNRLSSPPSTQEDWTFFFF